MDEPHTFKTPSGDEMVILTKAEYDALIEAAAEADEDAADAAIYAERKAGLERGTDEVLPLEVSMAIQKGEGMLKAVRRWRGKSQTDLAHAVGVAQSYVSAIEAGERRLTNDLVPRFAAALDVKPDWITPPGNEKFKVLDRANAQVELLNELKEGDGVIVNHDRDEYFAAVVAHEEGHRLAFWSPSDGAWSIQLYQINWPELVRRPTKEDFDHFAPNLDAIRH